MNALVNVNDLHESVTGLLSLADWMEEFDRDEADVERIEQLAERLRSAAVKVHDESRIWYLVITMDRSDYMGPDVELFVTENAARQGALRFINESALLDVDEPFTDVDAAIEWFESVDSARFYIDSRPVQGG
jgi:hypothetical protein